MSINTLGGSGNGTVSSAGSGAIESKTIFTTPATANYSYAVTVELGWPEGASALVENAEGSSAEQSHIFPVNKAGGRIKFLVGPSTAVQILVYGLTPGSKTINYNYHYVATNVP